MKEKIISIFFIVVIFVFAGLNLVISDKEVSIVERRKLVQFDSLKEDFNKNLDSYLMDQFPFREKFLKVNSTFKRFFLKDKGYNNVYLNDDYIFEQVYPLDLKSLNNFVDKINGINKDYLENSRVYISIIPDKSYFLKDKSYLTLDYNYIYSTLKEKINIFNIPINDLLSLEDYYKTDIHIKQPSYLKILNRFGDYFNFKGNSNYKKIVYDDFAGSSYYKVPFSKKESIELLTNNIIDKSLVKHLEYKDKLVYNVDMLKSSDPYNIFLNGPSSLIEIENNLISSDKELIIFRDSFGSSFAPLLIPFYKKITLIDLRYINMNIAKNYVDFNNKDILFLYSTLIVNNSFILK